MASPNRVCRVSLAVLFVSSRFSVSAESEFPAGRCAGNDRNEPKCAPAFRSECRHQYHAAAERTGSGFFGAALAFAHGAHACAEPAHSYDVLFAVFDCPRLHQARAFIAASAANVRVEWHRALYDDFHHVPHVADGLHERVPPAFKRRAYD